MIAATRYGLMSDAISLAALIEFQASARKTSEAQSLRMLSIRSPTNQVLFSAYMPREDLMVLYNTV